MFVEAIKAAKRSMFPIFRQEDLGNGTTNTAFAGTGFFINNQGVFATVAHVFDTSGPNVKFVYLGNLPDSLDGRGAIDVIAMDDQNDIAIGKIASIKSSDPVVFGEGVLEEGKSLCACGYPLAIIELNASGGLEVGGVRRYFQPTFILDKREIKNVTPKNRTHRGFLLRDAGLFGMSGGPVFGVDGKLYGMQGSVVTRISDSGTGKKITVENAFSIDSALVVDLARNNKII